MTLTEFVKKVSEVKEDLIRTTTTQDQFNSLVLEFSIDLNKFRGDMVFSEIARKKVLANG
jgi:Asp-tRNA(Asn)/Glu-tRNA(Gln) amidotransferase C subunit